MLTIEDERDILDEGYPIIVPLLVDEYDGDFEIEAYSGIESVATEFHSRFFGNFFSKSAIDWLDEKLRPYVEEKGYLRECTGKYKWYRRFEISSADLLAKDRVLDSTVMLTEGDYELLVSFSLSEQTERGLPTFVTLDGDKIVSIATVNEHSEDQKMLEITVETAPGYRGRGYAVSNTVALAEYLINNGFGVTYVCSRYNRASAAVAQRAGFVGAGRFYAYTAYKL